MRLFPGARLGPTRSLVLWVPAGWGKSIGARDTRLGREVAIKVLPEDFAAHHERLVRFERDAPAARLP